MVTFLVTFSGPLFPDFQLRKTVLRDEETHERAADAIEEQSPHLREIGTGTAISYRGRHFILTARHVVEDTPDEALRFFCRPEGSLRRMKRAELRGSEGIRVEDMYMLERIPILGRTLCDADDLAVLSVEPGIQERYRVRFYDFDDTATTPDAGHLVIALGYPSDIARQIETGNFVAFNSVEWTEVVRESSLTDFDSSRHFVAPYQHGGRRTASTSARIQRLRRLVSHRAYASRTALDAESSSCRRFRHLLPSVCNAEGSTRRAGG